MKSEHFLWLPCNRCILRTMWWNFSPLFSRGELGWTEFGPCVIFDSSIHTECVWIRASYSQHSPLFFAYHLNNTRPTIVIMNLLKNKYIDCKNESNKNGLQHSREKISSTEQPCNSFSVPSRIITICFGNLSQQRIERTMKKCHI